jgi:hypothetical protein
VSVGKNFREKLLVSLVVDISMLLKLLLGLINFYYWELDLFHLIMIILSIKFLLLDNRVLLVLLRRLFLIVTLVCILT